MINKYPYTDFNEYNLDWCIQRIRDLTDEWKATHDEWVSVEAAWEDYKHYFDNLDVQDEIDAKINKMIADGTFSAIVEPFFQEAIGDVPQIVSDWIDDNLMQETGYVIDASLTTANAAADAKAAGDLITDTDATYGAIITSPNLVDNDAWIDDYYINANTGAITASANYHYQFVRLPKPGDYVTYRQSSFGSARYYISLHKADKTYMKTVPCPQIAGGNASQVSFTLSAQDFAEGARYLGVSMQGSVDMVVYPGTSWIGGATVVGRKPVWTIEHARTVDSVTNKLNGKKIVAAGDSIMNGAYDLPDNLTGWFGRFISRNSMTGSEQAQNGAAITDGLTFLDLTPRYCIANSIETLYGLVPDADYVLLEGGVNDADVIGHLNTHPPKFGTWNANDFSGSYDVTTFCGAVDYMCYKAVTRFKGAKICYIIPPQMGRITSTVENRRAYFDTAIEICEKWHIPVLDLWKTSHMDTRLTAYYDPDLDGPGNVSAGSCYYDGQHPTSAGYNLTFSEIEAFILNL